MTITRTSRAAAVVLAMAAVRPPSLPAQDVTPMVTLADARSRALTVDPAAVASRSAMATAAWERRAAYANLLVPSLTAATSYIRLSEPFFNFGTGTITPNATSATLEAEYTVVGAGKLSAVKRANAAAASATASAEATRFRTTLVADAAYYDVLAQRELARVAADRQSRATEQLGVARVRVQAGETIATDSLQLLLEVNQARLEVLQADSALAVARLRLGRLIGLPSGADAALLDTAPPPPLPLTLEAAVAELRAGGPEVAAARAEERRAGAALSAERAAYFPALTLGAVLGAYDDQFFPSAAKRNQFAITVSLPLWDGGQREVAVAQARAQHDVARAELQDRERAAAEHMARAYRGYATAQARIELALVGVAVSTETYRVQGARYREGATTILDLLEAQVGLGEAEATLVQARHAARLTLAEIEALLGRRVFE
jgi:outer membrane protein TolC